MILVLFFCSACDARSFEQVYFLKALDGDTILIEYPSSKEIRRLRLIGVDAPESSQVPWGDRAKVFVETQIQTKSPIYIEYGPTREDKYSRILAYVFYHKNGQKYFLNSELLRNGWAEIFIFNRNDPHNSILKDSLFEAKSKQLNIWQSNGLEMSPQVYRRKHRRR